MRCQALPRPSDMPVDVMRRGQVRADVERKLNGERGEDESLSSEKVADREREAGDHPRPEDALAQRVLQKCGSQCLRLLQALDDAGGNIARRKIGLQSVSAA